MPLASADERGAAGQGCIVEVEGLKKARFWTFGVVDRGGISLMRMSTADGQAADAWVQARPLSFAAG